ncbi:hypothetical protein R3P38DRAFT_3194897 [Favolaschia claudopus]|uniref:F-box protein n=1 Tax=Favolaschia claudopus TaxID=2862362 RepID=A0AAW0BB55_9AGAR
MASQNGVRGRHASRWRHPARRSAAERFFDLAMGPHDALFSLLANRELVRLMSTSRRIRALIHDLCFDISRLLRRFFGSRENVEQFRYMQQQTGTIISGSIALQFLNRLSWEDSDLDLYVGHAMAPVAVVFILENGYTFKPKENQKSNLSLQLCSSGNDHSDQWSDYGDSEVSEVADVFDFHKGEQKIQLITAVRTPMQIILNFHCTCVMNLITHSTAFSLYPWHTFVRRKALEIDSGVSDVGQARVAARQKYTNRGWSMLNRPSSSSKSEFGLPVKRYLGDKFSWTITLCPPLQMEEMLGDDEGGMWNDAEVGTAWQIDRVGGRVFMTALEDPLPAISSVDLASKIDHLRETLRKMEATAAAWATARARAKARRAKR